jgi:hypothetical protein
MVTRTVRRRACLSTAVVATAWLASCDKPTAPSDPAAPVPGARTGPVAIEYAGANVAGTTIPGCGSTIAGCAGRLQLTFRRGRAGPPHRRDAARREPHRVPERRGRRLPAGGERDRDD